jgi:anti-sigma factor RsiW
MTCEEIESRMAEYWSKSLDKERESAIEAHLATCETCRAEEQRLGSLWRDLARLPAPEPGPGVRARFYETLEAYRDGAAAEMKHPSSGWRKTAWVWQMAAGVALALTGVAAGYSFHASQAANAEVAQLRGEVGNMRQLVALSLLQQQSASERLRGVSWTYRVEPSDTEVLAALLTAVNHDPNVNVRLAAVDALRPFAATRTTRDAVIQLLQGQTAPIVQVALIDLLVDLKETEAAQELRKVASDSSTDVGVRQRAQWALERLQ